MRAILHPFVLGLALLGLSACNNEQAASSAGSTPAADIGEVIATVNGVNIGSKEFEQAFCAATTGDTTLSDYCADERAHRAACVTDPAGAGCGSRRYFCGEE